MLPIYRKNDLVVQDMGDETFVYDLLTNRAICLNKMSSFVWKNCDGSLSAEGLASIASDKFGEKVTSELVELALDQLLKEDLIEYDDPASVFEGLSRREIIKKVGLTTMAALPIVTAITAPAAAAAQSVCVPVSGGCTCTEGSNGRMGQQCVEAMACANGACRCVWANNGMNNTAGDCIV
ncbi:MAG: PqqD family protein [Acidobacteria bacterium]|nr:MAG: PqqD family protein [Acidobacteriota bacterium]REK02499.1 MAG: PqqD family protein [Acidobacteriota bacterium]REK13699.1 MAG: PqqD family protein [Acidobacteriota bacterium]REK41693.1 MAG: PqqD family protein [Acidobacteriota bacterium]